MFPGTEEISQNILWSKSIMCKRFRNNFCSINLINIWEDGSPILLTDDLAVVPETTGVGELGDQHVEGPQVGGLAGDDLELGLLEPPDLGGHGLEEWGWGHLGHVWPEWPLSRLIDNTAAHVHCNTNEDVIITKLLIWTQAQKNTRWRLKIMMFNVTDCILALIMISFLSFTRKGREDCCVWFLFRTRKLV